MQTANDTLALQGGTPVRQNPYPRHPEIGVEERNEVAEVLDYGPLSGFIASPGVPFRGGPKVRKLETAFEDYFGVEHTVAMNSATSCLHAAVAALGCGPGDEVIVTPYTMSASAAAILMCNAVPVFADIDPDFFKSVLATFCIDQDLRALEFVRSVEDLLGQELNLVAPVEDSDLISLYLDLIVAGLQFLPADHRAFGKTNRMGAGNHGEGERERCKD